MNLLFSIFANDVLPVFVVAAVGFAVARVLGADVRTMSRITFNALSPCLVFDMMVTSSLGAGDFGRMTALAVLTIASIGILARLAAVAFRLDRPMTAAFLLVVMFSNSGNYGLPVIMFAFGRDALAHATVYFVVNAVATYTLGVFFASAGHRSLARAASGILRVPAVWAVVAAAVVMALGVHLPPAVTRPIDLLSDAALPAMILVLGMQFERGAWPGRPALVLAVAVLALVVTPILAFGFSRVIGLVGPARQAAILQSGMPSAVLTTIIALEYDVAPSFVTACVMLTTLASPLTVTLLIAALR